METFLIGTRNGFPKAAGRSADESDEASATDLAAVGPGTYVWVRTSKIPHGGTPSSTKFF